MNKFRFTINTLAVAAFVLAVASMAQAQATRTWVSGVGDDVNPCSRTAPCKTFAGAISKTAANGEIDCLDPGGFGTVTITKSITIDGTHGGGFGSILASGTNGVNVNDSASGSPNTIIVSLRNLSIQGAGTGFDGIRFTSGKTVHVEDCVIANFRGNGASSDGIEVALNSGVASALTVTNTIIRDNSANGINAANVGAGSISVVMDGDEVLSNASSGFVAVNHAQATITNSTFTHNGTGVTITSLGTGVEMDTCYLAFNTSGIVSAGGTSRIANLRITANTNGVNFGGGTVQSYGDNKIKGNTNDQLGGAITNVPAPAKI